jgi:hypothetical protein
MKNRDGTHARNNSPWKITWQSMQLYAWVMDAKAMVSICWLMWLVFLPFRMLAATGRFFDSFALASVRWLARLCFGALAMAILSTFVWAFVRTVFHPWF